jgi:hypothetical protein
MALMLQVDPAAIHVEGPPEPTKYIYEHYLFHLVQSETLAGVYVSLRDSRLVLSRGALPGAIALRASLELDRRIVAVLNDEVDRDELKKAVSPSPEVVQVPERNSDLVASTMTIFFARPLTLNELQMVHQSLKATSRRNSTRSFTYDSTRAAAVWKSLTPQGDKAFRQTRMRLLTRLHMIIGIISVQGFCFSRFRKQHRS